MEVGNGGAHDDGLAGGNVEREGGCAKKSERCVGAGSVIESVTGSGSAW